MLFCVPCGLKNKKLSLWSCQTVALRNGLATEAQFPVGECMGCESRNDVCTRRVVFCLRHYYPLCCWCSRRCCFPGTHGDLLSSIKSDSWCPLFSKACFYRCRCHCRCRRRHKAFAGAGAGRGIGAGTGAVAGSWAAWKVR